uniref:PRA1 family protein n=2 Tax=Chelonoidis abingdonii TaxID=106734 RepID=A0A8C0HJR1_CHEAB
MPAPQGVDTSGGGPFMLYARWRRMLWGGVNAKCGHLDSWVLTLPCPHRYFRPLHTLLSSSAVTLIFVAFVWAAENKAPIRRFRRSYPGASLLAVLGSAYGLVSILGGSEVFLLTVALPISMILIHASVRLRNLKNKIENKIESIGLKRTPMGLLLEAMGQEQEAGS